MKDALIVGGGFAGIGMAIQLKKLGISDFIILEKSEGAGGTWKDNFYPGAKCDVTSLLYSFTFEPYPYWNFKFSHQSQILKYLQHCIKKYGLRKHFHFQKELSKAYFDAKDQAWDLNTKDGGFYRARHLIIATGQLNEPWIPELKGAKTFKGEQFHSARWNKFFDYRNKKVGVVGTGASALQLIPEVAKVASELTVFQRSPNWVLEKKDRHYKPWEKKLAKEQPWFRSIGRFISNFNAGVLYNVMKRSSWLRPVFEKQAAKYLKFSIGDPELIKALTPDYPMGAKRVLFSDEYFETFRKPHVTLNTDGIHSLNAKGIKSDKGEQVDLDLLVYATGFKTHPFLSQLEIVNGEGTQLPDSWKEDPQTFMGIHLHGFPNLHLMYGPYTNLGHNSIILMLEAQANYISQFISHGRSSDWPVLEVKVEAVKDFQDEMEWRMEEMIWTKVKNSWYLKNGRSINNWPGKVKEYQRRTKKADFTKYLVVPAHK